MASRHQIFRELNEYVRGFQRDFELNDAEFLLMLAEVLVGFSKEKLKEYESGKGSPTGNASRSIDPHANCH